jgi:hypothetical protein
MQEITDREGRIYEQACGDDMDAEWNGSELDRVKKAVCKIVQEVAR